MIFIHLLSIRLIKNYIHHRKHEGFDNKQVDNKKYKKNYNKNKNINKYGKIHPKKWTSYRYYRYYPKAGYNMVNYTDLYNDYYKNYWFVKPHGANTCGGASCETRSPIFQPNYDLYPCLQCSDCGLCQYDDNSMQCMPGNKYGPTSPNIDPKVCTNWYHG